jgi:photosystem II stability/assembly factor-like uncharacterized protein
MNHTSSSMNKGNPFSWLIWLLLVSLTCLLVGCSSASATNSTTPPTPGTQNAGNGTTVNSSAAGVTTNGTSINEILPTLPLTHIRMLDTTHGWALDKNNILKTSDGGQSWVALTPAGAAVNPAVNAEFLSDLYAWVVIPNIQAGTVTVFRTSTGGASWQSSSIHESSVEGALVTFINRQVGWLELSPNGAGAGSEGVDIFQTVDGGIIWNKIASTTDARSGLPNGGIKSGLSFRDALNGWATGEDASNSPWLYATHDGGHTWSKQALSGRAFANTMYQLEPPVLFGNDGLLPVDFSNGSSSQFILYVTHDGGKTWTNNGQAIAAINNSNAYALDMHLVWATDSQSGDFYQTRNGGQSWQMVASNPGINGALSFVDANTGFALGSSDQAVLKRTTDGGHTWQTIKYEIHG